ncbi:MAG: glycosyltransferase family 39 protein [Kiritimatiellales bacterium]|jgi:4-amino-4-deoxy-L-arabinose transferase-like glycosyltransferase
MAKQQQQPFESTLQDLVYSVDAGLGLKIIRTTLFCLFILGLIIIFTARQFRGFDTEAAMDYAQLGRNLAQSHRYVTQCIRPVSIAQVSAHSFDGDARIDRHPELTKPPLYPAILAANFKFFNLVGIDLFPISTAFQGIRIYPAEQWVIVPLHHFFTVLSGLLLYLLGRKMFSHKIGLLSVLTYFLSEMVWMDSIHGTGIPILMFFVLGATYFALLAMINRRERKSLWNWMAFFCLSIIFSAAAFLTNYAALAVIPGLTLFIWMMGSRTQRGGHLAFFYAALIFLIVSPWLLRNYQLSGSPLGLAPHTALIDSAKYPGDSLMRTLKPNFNLMPDIRVAKEKWAKNFNTLYENGFTSMGGGLLIAFFMVTFFYRFVRVPVHNLRWGIGLSMVLFFIGAGFFGSETLRLYHIFWPFVILYGLAFFSILLDRLDLSIQLYKMGLTALVIGMTALPLLVTIFLSSSPGLPYPPYYAPFVMRVSELLKPNEVICTDMPWATAWYGKRISILLPKTLDDYYEINDYRKYISGLYITTLTKDRPFVSSLLEGSEKTWLPITMGRLPPNFPLKQGFALNKQDQLFLTDTVRWGADQVQKPAGGEQGGK